MLPDSSPLSTPPCTPSPQKRQKQQRGRLPSVCMTSTKNSSIGDGEELLVRADFNRDVPFVSSPLSSPPISPLPPKRKKRQRHMTRSKSPHPASMRVKRRQCINTRLQQNDKTPGSNVKTAVTSKDEAFEKLLGSVYKGHGQEPILQPLPGYLHGRETELTQGVVFQKMDYSYKSGTLSCRSEGDTN